MQSKTINITPKNPHKPYKEENRREKFRSRVFLNGCFHLAQHLDFSRTESVSWRLRGSECRTVVGGRRLWSQTGLHAGSALIFTEASPIRSLFNFQVFI